MYLFRAGGRHEELLINTHHHNVSFSSVTHSEPGTRVSFHCGLALDAAADRAERVA